MPVSKRLRYEILKRDNHACRYCGAAATDAKLTVDHVTPVSRVGSGLLEHCCCCTLDCLRPAHVVFAYMGGIARKKIEQLHERAKQILEGEATDGA